MVWQHFWNTAIHVRRRKEECLSEVFGADSLFDHVSAGSCTARKRQRYDLFISRSYLLHSSEECLCHELRNGCGYASVQSSCRPRVAEWCGRCERGSHALSTDKAGHNRRSDLALSRDNGSCVCSLLVAAGAVRRIPFS